MSDCLFCSIVSGTIPAFIIYEDDRVLAFLDIMPAHEGHTLVIPKNHHSELWDLSDQNYNHLMNIAKTLSSRLADTIECKRVGMALEGFEVDHAHLHLIPLNDGLSDTLQNKPHTPVNNAILQKTHNKLKSQ